jgi:hypothetical protein
VLEIARAGGFAPKAKAPTPAQSASAETEQERITRIAKGQEAGFSLRQAGGSKAPNNKSFDAKTLASMSDEDFSAFLSRQGQEERVA